MRLNLTISSKIFARLMINSLIIHTIVICTIETVQHLDDQFSWANCEFHKLSKCWGVREKEIVGYNAHAQHILKLSNWNCDFCLAHSMGNQLAICWNALVGNIGILLFICLCSIEYAENFGKQSIQIEPNEMQIHKHYRGLNE